MSFKSLRRVLEVQSLTRTLGLSVASMLLLLSAECGAAPDGGRVEVGRGDTLSAPRDTSGPPHVTRLLAALCVLAVLGVGCAATPNDGGAKPADQELKKSVIGIVGRDRARFVKDGAIRRMQELSLEGADAALVLKISGLFRSQKKMKFQPAHAKQILALLKRREQASKRAVREEKEALTEDEQEDLLAKGRSYELEVVPEDGSGNSITPVPVASGAHADDDTRRAIQELYTTIVDSNLKNLQTLMAEHLEDERLLKSAMVPNRSFAKSPGILAVVGLFEHAASGLAAAINVSNRLSERLMRMTADELMIAQKYWSLGLSRYLPRPLIAHPLFVPASDGTQDFLVAITVMEWMGGEAGNPLEKLSFRPIEGHETLLDSKWYRWPHLGRDHVELTAEEIGPATTEVAAAISYHALPEGEHVTTISDLMLGTGAFVYRRLPEGRAEVKMVAAPSLRAQVPIAKFVQDLIAVNLKPSPDMPKLDVWDVETALTGLVRGREHHAADARAEGVDEATARARGRAEAAQWIQTYVESPKYASRSDAARRFLADLDVSGSHVGGAEG